LVWLPVLFAYKGFVLLAGLFLAFETRKVKYTALNESRFITASIYGAVITAIALTPIGLLLQSYPNTQYGVSGIMIMLSITLILGLVFASKVSGIYIYTVKLHASMIICTSLDICLMALISVY